MSKIKVGLVIFAQIVFTQVITYLSILALSFLGTSYFGLDGRDAYFFLVAVFYLNIFFVLLKCTFFVMVLLTGHLFAIMNFENSISRIHLIATIFTAVSVIILYIIPSSFSLTIYSIFIIITSLFLGYIALIKSKLTRSVVNNSRYFND